VSKFVFNRKFRAYKSPTFLILNINHKLETKESSSHFLHN